MSTFGSLARNGKFLIGIIFGCIVSVIIFVLIYSLFTLQTIEIVGDGMQISIDTKRFPHNILFIQEKRITDELLKNYPQLASVKVQKRYPHTLVIAPILREGVARLSTEIGSFQVDSEGVVLDDTNPDKLLPVLDIPVMRATVGQPIKDEQFLSALKFIYAMKGLMQINVVNILDGASLSVKTSTTEILIPQGGNAVSLAATLQTLLTGFRMKGALPAIIDLRFDKPVITN